MRVMVTGGAGFIGSHLVERIVETHPDWEVVVYDAFTYAGRWENLAAVMGLPNVAVINGDVRDDRDVMSAMCGCDAVLHLAAESHVDRSIAGGRAFVETNVTGTYNVVDAANRLNLKRLVYVSTDEVYGSCPTGQFAEGAPLNPSSPYSASKAAGELIALSYFRTHQLPVVVTRGSNTLGPRQHPEKLIPKAIIKALLREKMPVYGVGDQVRDWMWVGDHVDGILAALAYGTAGETYNLGAGNERQNLWVIDRIYWTFLLQMRNYIEPVADRKGHDYRYAIDSRYALGSLGWKATFDLTTALSHTIDWYQQNIEWWRPLLTTG